MKLMKKNMMLSSDYIYCQDMTKKILLSTLL